MTDLKRMEVLLSDIRACKACAHCLEPNPVLSIAAESRILIIGQAPGRIVHETGIPWNDKSGENLRNWMGVDRKTFYDTRYFGIMPMGFCYPGTGKSGDLPPRPECAELWHQKLLDSIRKVDLILLIGQYAQKYYLKESVKDTLTETVRNFKDFLPEFFTLPHPSPRNNLWMAKNKWFEEETLPELRDQIKRILNN